MKIRVKVIDNWGGVSLSTGQFGSPGEEYTVPDEEGAVLCAEGLADPVADPDKDVEKRAAAVDPKAVRAWAKENGVEVAAKGAVPTDVVEQYKAAQG